MTDASSCHLIREKEQTPKTGTFMLQVGSIRALWSPELYSLLPDSEPEFEWLGQSTGRVHPTSAPQDINLTRILPYQYLVLSKRAQ